MNRYAEFSYVQARLQTRHGQRPTDSHWTPLRSTHDLGHFLQLARTTPPLRPWVIHFSPQSGIHDIEYSLRHQFRAYVAEVAAWQPKRWRAPLAWCAWLADLPALQHLMQEHTALGWMFDDPILKGLASENMAMRKAALRDSPIGLLYAAWQRGQSLPSAWLEQWRRHWPDDAPQPYGQGLEKVAALVERHREHFVALRPELTNQGREQLDRRLQFTFRRLPMQPAAAYLHLAMVGLDVERLRGELVRRVLFGSARESAA